MCYGSIAYCIIRPLRIYQYNVQPEALSRLPLMDQHSLSTPAKLLGISASFKGHSPTAMDTKKFSVVFIDFSPTRSSKNKDPARMEYGNYDFTIAVEPCDLTLKISLVSSISLLYFYQFVLPSTFVLLPIKFLRPSASYCYE